MFHAITLPVLDVYGLILHIYIIFGTNLLIGGPNRIVVFCLFQCFEEKEYQTESKRNETFESDLFGKNAIQETWSGRQAVNEAATRVPGAPPTLMGPSLLHRRTPSSYIYLRIPKRSEQEPKT